MKIVTPSVEVYFHYPHKAGGGQIEPQVFLELVGRTCYKSEDKITGESAPKFIAMLNKRGHHAMLEHCSASVKFVCDRGVSHELVRHRLCAFGQISTRYCNYAKEKFDREISVIEPPGLSAEARRCWQRSCGCAEDEYMRLIELGMSPQIARSVLPTCLMTEIWCTANLREWMHIFKLRCAPEAHPQMRELMLQAQKVFAEKIPELFANDQRPEKAAGL